MSDQNLNIHIVGLDEFSSTFAKLNQTMNTSKATMEDVGRSMRSIGREVSQIGSAFTTLGASITAPLLLAYNNAGKYSAAITRQLDDMRKQWDEISISIGKSLLPIMQSLTNLIQGLISRWNSLSQEQKDHIVQVAFLVGQYTLFGGIALKVLGSVFKVLGDGILLFIRFAEVIDGVAAKFLKLLFFQPELLLIYGIIAAIVVVLWKWKEPLDYVFDLLQKNADIALVIYNRMAATFDFMTGKGDLAQKHMEEAAKAWQDLTTFKPGQHGGLANGVDNMKASVGDFVNSIKGGISTLGDFANILNGKGFGGVHQGGSSGKGFWDGFLKGAEDARIKMEGVFQVGQTAATDAIKGMNATFSSFFDDAFTGQLKKAEDYFIQFGNSLIKTFSNALSQMATNWIMFGSIFGSQGGTNWGGIIGGIAGLFAGGASVVGGGTTSASFFGDALSGSGVFDPAIGMSLPSFDVGTDYVPRDMIAKIHKGEKITPAGQNSGGVSITIAPVISLWDASDIQRNKKIMIDAITEAITQNGTIRQVIKQYS